MYMFDTVFDLDLSLAVIHVHAFTLLYAFSADIFFFVWGKVNKAFSIIHDASVLCLMV